MLPKYRRQLTYIRLRMLACTYVYTLCTRPVELRQCPSTGFSPFLPPHPRSFRLPGPGRPGCTCRCGAAMLMEKLSTRRECSSRDGTSTSATNTTATGRSASVCGTILCPTSALRVPHLPNYVLQYCMELVADCMGLVNVSIPVCVCVAEAGIRGLQCTRRDCCAPLSINLDASHGPLSQWCLGASGSIGFGSVVPRLCGRPFSSWNAFPVAGSLPPPPPPARSAGAP